MTVGFVAIAGPMALGGLNARPLRSSVQSASAEPLTFEVASIKANNSGEPRVTMRRLPGGAYEAINVTMRALIQQAYGMSEQRVLGGPSWLETDRFDVQARSPEGALDAEVPARIRTMLAERLSLRTHRDTREMPTYELVFARADGQLGPQIPLFAAEAPEAAYPDRRRHRLRRPALTPFPSSPPCRSSSACGSSREPDR